MELIQSMYNEGPPDGKDCDGQPLDPSSEGPGCSQADDDYSMPPEIAEAIRESREQSAAALNTLGQSRPIISRLILRALWAEARREFGSVDFSGEGSG